MKRKRMYIVLNVKNKTRVGSVRTGAYQKPEFFDKHPILRQLKSDVGLVNVGVSKFL